MLTLKMFRAAAGIWMKRGMVSVLEAAAPALAEKARGGVGAKLRLDRCGAGGRRVLRNVRE
jgi:hypothetical protein